MITLTDRELAIWEAMAPECRMHVKLFSGGHEELCELLGDPVYMLEEWFGSRPKTRKKINPPVCKLCNARQCPLLTKAGLR